MNIKRNDKYRFNIARIVLATIWGLSICINTSLAEESTKPTSLKKSKESIQKLANQLVDDHYQTRQRATQELSKLGSAAILPVAKIAAGSDLEGSIRAITILKKTAHTLEFESQEEMIVLETLEKVASAGRMNSEQARLVLKGLIKQRESKCVLKFTSLGARYTTSIQPINAVEDPVLGDINEVFGKKWIFRGGVIIDEDALKQVGMIVITDQFKGTTKDLRLLKYMPANRGIHLQGSKIDDQWLDALSQTRHFTTLILENTKVTQKGLQALSRMPGLENLTIKGSSISNLRLSNLLKLETLSFDSAEVSAISLENLPQLVSLNLASKKLRTIEFQKLTGLTSLALSMNEQSEYDLKLLKATPNLRSLLLTGRKVTDDQIKHLEKLTNLSTLSIKRASITDQGVAHLAKIKSLTQLVIRYTPVTDKGLPAIEKMKQLQLVQLYGTKVTGRAAKALELARGGSLSVDHRNGALLGIGGAQGDRQCYITTVKPNSSAAKAGMRVSDIIIEFAGTPIQSFEDLKNAVSKKQVGDQVQATILRHGSKKQLSITLGEWK